MPSGSVPTLATHAITIQEVGPPDTASGVGILGVEYPTITLSKHRTNRPQEVVIKPCCFKANVFHSVGENS